MCLEDLQVWDSVLYNAAHLYGGKQTKEVLRLVASNPSRGVCRPAPIFQALFHGRTVNRFAIQRDVQSLSDKFNRVLADGLVEIGIYLLWKTFKPQDLNGPRQ